MVENDAVGGSCEELIAEVGPVWFSVAVPSEYDVVSGAVSGFLATIDWSMEGLCRIVRTLWSLLDLCGRNARR